MKKLNKELCREFDGTNICIVDINGDLIEITVCENHITFENLYLVIPRGHDYIEAQIWETYNELIAIGGLC